MIHRESHTTSVTVVSMVDVSGRAIVRLSGKEAQDLLNRLSTNDLSTLQNGEVAQTVLTNEKGKIVDVLSVLKTADETLLLFGQTQGGESLQRWLEKFIIMEEVRAENVTNHYAHLLLYNTGSRDQTEWASRKLGQFTTLDQQKLQAITFTEQWGNAELQHIFCPLESRSTIVEMYQHKGYLSKEISDFEYYRISRGIPGHPHELSTEYNPMEAGLLEMISFSKGCYIGQEVIARLDTYKKVQKSLVRLELGAQPRSLPQRLYSGSEVVGTVTSFTPFPNSHTALALGYVKTSYGRTQPLYYLKDIEKITVTIID